MSDGNSTVQPLVKAKPLGMQRELLQIVAMLTMLIDHIGAALYPDQFLVLRFIGRLAFPLYAFGIVQGYLYTHNIQKYVLRLGLLALISQFPFMWAFDYIEVNVIGTFFICILTLIAMERTRIILLQILIACAAFLLFSWIPTDYGTYALMMILIFRYTSSYFALLLHFFLNLYYYWTGGVIYQFISMVSTIWLIWGAKARPIPFTIPRWLWLSFYPAHLFILAIIKWLFY